MFGEKISEFVRSHFGETILLLLSFVFGIGSILTLLFSTQPPQSHLNETHNPKTTPAIKNTYVDIEGAVLKPGVYKMWFGARVKDVLLSAGGLHNDADESFIQKNINLSQILSDQDKLYIPFNTDTYKAMKKINLNTATSEELNTLPGIGTVTAQKIMSSRPFHTNEDLVTKKIISQSQLQKIISLITTL